MHLLTSLLPILAGSCLLLGALVFCRCGRRGVRRRPRARLEINPRYRSFLRRHGLTEAAHFLALPEVILSGHPDRRVGRVTLGAGPEKVTAFLKREHRVSWAVRLLNALAGFGLVSRSLREARTLRALGREGLSCPEWLAAGEDGRGRAFLLVREVSGAADLPAYLRGQPDRACRRRMARCLGTALARLHRAGFAHPDLYGKHVLVNPREGQVAVLDWQRARRRTLTWRARARGLAALHATLAENLASDRERLACLRAYLRACGESERGGGIGGMTPPARQNREMTPPARQGLVRFFLREIEAHARRLLSRRHVREKRQALPPPDPQAWTCLDGEALCVTPALQRLCAGQVPGWLALDVQPEPPGPGPARRWLQLPGATRALLVRRRSRHPLTALWCWLRRRPLASPEQRTAALLLRLARHAVPAPRVLAMGQRRRLPWQVESFLLTEPVADTVRLDVWLARQAALPPAAARAARRRRVLRQAGALLQRLHEASCYLDGRAGRCPLALQFPPAGAPVVVLDDVGAVCARRRHHPGLARRDVRRLRQALAAAGCDRADLRRFLRGYRQAAPALLPAPARARPLLPGPMAPPPATLPPPDAASPTADTAVARPGLLPQGPAPERRETFWRRLVRGARRLCQRPGWESFAGPDWANRIMGVEVTDRFQAKQGRTTGRWVLRTPAGPARPGRTLTVYLKRHYRLPWWHGLLATFWPYARWSPALQEWDNLEWARRQGLPVPPAVAAAEYVGPWGRLQSALAVEELAGMLPLSEAIPLAFRRLDPAAFRRWKRGLVAEVARLTRLLHDRRCFHKDLYLCHFFLARQDTADVPEGWRGRVFLIDLHRLARHRWTWRLWQMKDLAQLLYSAAVPGLGVRDQLYFWQAYCGTGPGRGAGRWLRRGVLIKCWRYRYHNARHRAAKAEDLGPTT